MIPYNGNLPPGCSSRDIEGSAVMERDEDVHECADCGREFTDGEARDTHYMSADCPQFNADHPQFVSKSEYLNERGTSRLSEDDWREDR